jgi:predicted DNA-binding protein (UPF0251 family)
MNEEMINSIAGIAAEGDRAKEGEGAEFLQKRQKGDSAGQAFSVQELRVADLSVAGISLTPQEIANLPVHQFPAKPAVQAAPPVASEVKEAEDVDRTLQQTQAVEQAESAQEEVEFCDDDRERRIYRGRTVAMLRRYMRYSIETGRLPSLLGREFFRAQITKYQVSTFEDRVIFVHDMDRCLDQLDEFSREVLGRVVLQEYEHEEAARLMGCTRMTVHRKLIEALDALSDILIAVGLLDGLGSNGKKSCQGGKSDDFPASDCEHGE